MKYHLPIALFVLLITGCTSAQKSPTLVGKWQQFKLEKVYNDSILDETKFYPTKYWVFSSTQMEAIKGDPVNYVLKDSVIYLKGAPWYKIEKLTKNELVVIETDCDITKGDFCLRSYFNRVKTFK